MLEEWNGTWLWIIGSGVLVVGLISTLTYYFSRYYFKTHEKDLEVIGPLYESKKEEGRPPAVEAPKNEDLPLTREPLPKLEPVAKVKDLKEALYQTRQGLWGRIKDRFSNNKEFIDEDFESLEEILYTSDLGPQTVHRLVEAVGEGLNNTDKKDADKVRTSIKNEMLSIFNKLAPSRQSLIDEAKNHSSPFVVMIVGVNGAGKTTTIGKLANLFASSGLKTLVIAGDTFRAAAGEQLNIWSQRADVEIFQPENVKDPSAVAFDGCQLAKSKNIDVAIIDTAGRLHTQSNLMEELKKMKRVMSKVLPEAPHEVLIVLDANSGQNALVQAKMFNEALDLTGAVLTKLDGTAKGGVAVGLAYELSLPIRMIGVGEGLEDLRKFESNEFVDSII